MRLYLALEPGYQKIVNRARELGCCGLLTNPTLLYQTYGADMSIAEMTEQMLNETGDMLVFTSVHGRNAQEIIDMAENLAALSSRVGVKIVTDEKGLTAIRMLSKKGIRCIATGMFTYGQAYLAAAEHAYAISPFMHRGTEYGLPMTETLQKIRALYSTMAVAPEIIAASIRTVQEAENALSNGADSVASGYSLLKQMAECDYSAAVEKDFGRSLRRIKGNDVSYLSGLDDDAPTHQE